MKNEFHFSDALDNKFNEVLHVKEPDIIKTFERKVIDDNENITDISMNCKDISYRTNESIKFIFNSTREKHNDIGKNFIKL